jgi:hypothetical protein
MQLFLIIFEGLLHLPAMLRSKLISYLGISARIFSKDKRTIPSRQFTKQWPNQGNMPGF